MSRYPVSARVPWPGSETAEIPYEQPAPRIAVDYRCTRGHAFDVPFAAEPASHIPAAWTCRCGQPARTSHPAAVDLPPEARHGKARDLEPDETGRDHHMRLVRMRRTDAELEAILADARAELHR